MRYFSSASLRCVSSAAVLVISAAFSCAHAGFDSNLIKNLDKECSQGDGSACLSLGEFYQTGEEVREDQVKALFYYEKACDLDNSVSCSIAGSYYASDNKEAKALELYQKACSMNHVDSCAYLASIYEKGDGIKKDLNKAVRYYTSTCYFNDPDSCYTGGSLSLENNDIDGNIIRARELFVHGCNLDHKESCVKAGALLQKGMDITPVYSAAAALYSKGCELGDVRGCLGIVSMSSLRNSADADDIKREFLPRACELGDKKSCDFIKNNKALFN